MKEKVKIGVVTVPEAFIYHKNNYETASWYKDIEVAPGDYPVMADVVDGLVNAYEHILIKFSGVVTASFFPSSFGGVMYGNGDRPEDIGKSVQFAMSVRSYEIAWAWLKNEKLFKNFEIKLNGIEPRVMQYRGDDGRINQTAGLFSVDFPMDDETMSRELKIERSSSIRKISDQFGEDIRVNVAELPARSSNIFQLRSAYEYLLAYVPDEDLKLMVGALEDHKGKNDLSWASYLDLTKLHIREYERARKRGYSTWVKP